MTPTSFKPINKVTRLVAMLTDHGFMSFAMMFFAVPYIISDLAKSALFHHHARASEAISVPYFALIGFALFFCKDCINGRSMAKRIFGWQLINNKTGEIASPFRCLVRDIFAIIWPVEVIVPIFNVNRRIGDWVAGTKLIIFDPELKKSPIKIPQLLACFILAYGLILLSFIWYIK